MGIKSLLTKHMLRNLQSKPLSEKFGLDRGTPIDRYYIEKFLFKYSYLIKGEIIEIGDSYYTKKFGGSKVRKSYVFSNTKGDGVDFVGDLTLEDTVKDNIADIFIMTQTLPFIYDYKSVVKNVLKMLRPGGCLLITVPGITQISRYDYERWGHYWSFTDMSLKKVLQSDVVEQLEIETYGNVKATCAFLYGMAAHEMKKEDMDYKDDNFQMLLTAVVQKKKNV